jgi:hypothetical protein
MLVLVVQGMQVPLEQACQSVVSRVLGKQNQNGLASPLQQDPVLLHQMHDAIVVTHHLFWVSFLRKK